MFRASWGGFSFNEKPPCGGNSQTNNYIEAKASENRPETQKERIIFQLATIKFPRAKNGGITQFNQPAFEEFFQPKDPSTPSLKQKNPTSNGFSPVRKGIR